MYIDGVSVYVYWWCECESVRTLTMRVSECVSEGDGERGWWR